ncbi:hypothetical protein [Chitinilyticum piscinae]|uniref:DUF4369 domain-containing protein n=1 Tax=Chitinilyticum piscinae TaxID=2866724 RepID=A0A8J7FLE0_9NEIS|nr:hypothetical protein [Chitinilyticum piscinae]MBE9609987.1 hypothetical protein [Chitinilyticum piscinae]
MIRALFTLLLSWSVGALAAPHIVALQSARTELLIDANRREALKPYSRLTSGDTLDIASGGSMQIVWIDDGHQEHWQGPARLTLGENRASEASGRQPASIRTLPPAMRAALAQTRSDLRQIRQLGAVSNVRSSKLPESTLALYRDWRREAAASDTGPELYLLHEQLRLNDWAGLGDTLRRLQALDPTNSELQAASAALAAALAEAPTP